MERELTPSEKRMLRHLIHMEEFHRQEYCTQNAGNCATCSLLNYGRDCQNNSYCPNPVEGLF